MDPVDAGFPGKPGIHPRCSEFHHLLFQCFVWFYQLAAPGDFDGSVRTIRLIIKHGFIQKFCF